MRTYELPTFADPTVAADGVEFLTPPGVTPNSPRYQAAQQACRRLMPADGP